jgi:homoserine O-acetyltransferase
LQFEQVNYYILEFLKEVLLDIINALKRDSFAQETSIGAITKTSTFGEAKVEDITAW